MKEDDALSRTRENASYAPVPRCPNGHGHPVLPAFPRLDPPCSCLFRLYLQVYLSGSVSSQFLITLLVAACCAPAKPMLDCCQCLFPLYLQLYLSGSVSGHF